MSALRAFESIPGVDVAAGDLSVLADRIFAILGVGRSSTPDLATIYKHTLVSAAFDLDEIVTDMENDGAKHWGALRRIQASLELVGDLADVLQKFAAFNPPHGEAANG